MLRSLCALGAAALLLGGCDKLQKLVGDDDSPQQQGRKHLEKGQAAEQKGEDDTALHEYEQARLTLQNDPQLSAALGRLYAARGDDAQAVMNLKRAVELNPQDTQSRGLLADVYLRQKQPQLAAQVLKSLASSDDIEANVKLIRTLILTNKPADALAAAEKLAQAHPESAMALSAHAEALMANGNPDRAAELLDAAVKSAPEDVDVRLARARFLSKRGMHDQALQELERGNAAQSNRNDVVFARAHELALLGRYADAGKVLDAFTAEHPNDPEAQSTLAWVKLQAGDVEAARAAAEAVLRRRPIDEQALYVRARCLEGVGEETRAIGAYRAVLNTYPGNAEALERLWQLYEKQGQVTDAITTLETLLQTGDAKDTEKLELARLYSETGFNSARGLKLVDELARSGAGKGDDLAGIRRKLQENAAKEHAHGGYGGQGGGPMIIKPGRR